MKRKEEKPGKKGVKAQKTDTKKKMRWHKLSEIKEALKKSHGFVTFAARSLGMNHSSVSERIKNSPELQQVVEECMEENLDLGEIKLLEAVNKCEGWAVCFLLKTKGKKRGFVERVENEHSGPGGGKIQLVLSGTIASPNNSSEPPLLPETDSGPYGAI